MTTKFNMAKALGVGALFALVSGGAAFAQTYGPNDLFYNGPVMHHTLVGEACPPTLLPDLFGPNCEGVIVAPRLPPANPGPEYSGAQPIRHEAPLHHHHHGDNDWR
jgi:hypothetical protein